MPRDLSKDDNYMKIEAEPPKTKIGRYSIKVEKKYKVEGNDPDQVGSVSAHLARELNDWRD
jgi:hypothetical protein